MGIALLQLFQKLGSLLSNRHGQTEHYLFDLEAVIPEASVDRNLHRARRAFGLTVAGYEPDADGPGTSWIDLFEQSLVWYSAYVDNELHVLSGKTQHRWSKEDQPENGVDSDFLLRSYQALNNLAKYLSGPENSVTMHSLRGLIPPGIVLHAESRKLPYTDHEQKASQLVFIFVGLLTMLYQPVLDLNFYTCDVRRPMMPSNHLLLSESIQAYSHPVSRLEHLELHEVLNSFGNLIPGSTADSNLANSDSFVDDISEQLMISYINLHTLIHIGKLEIIFVDSLSLHLELDEKHRTLSIFRFPAYCYLLCSDEPMLKEVVSRKPYLSK